MNSINDNIDHFCLEWSERDNISFADNPVHHINIGVFPSEIFNLNGHRLFCSDNVYMVKLLSITLKASISISYSKENIGGSLDYNGKTWLGVLGLIANQSVDFIPHFYTSNKEREAIADFYPTVSTPKLLSFLTIPSFDSENVFKIFMIFDRNVWSLIFVSLLTYSFLNCLTPNSTINICIRIFIDYFGLLIGQGSLKIKSNQFYMITGFWLISTFILRLMFDSDIQALLRSKRVVTIDTFDELLEQKQIVPLMYKDSSIYQRMKELYPGLAARVETIAFQDTFQTNTLSRLFNKNTALIGTEYDLTDIANFYYYFPFHLASEGSMYYIGGFPLRKNIEKNLMNKMKRCLKYIYLAGIFGKESKKRIEFYRFRELIANDFHTGFPKPYKYSEQEVKEHFLKRDNQYDYRIKLGELKISFALLVCGLFISYLTLIIEYFIFKLRKHRVYQVGMYT